MDFTDPINWSIQTVKDEICSNTRLPGWDAASLHGLGKLLEEHCVTGRVLLLSIDKEELRKDLKIALLADRCQIMSHILYLREQSKGYQAYLAKKVLLAPAQTTGATPAPPGAGTTRDPTEQNGRRRIPPTWISANREDLTEDSIDPNDKDYRYLLEKYPPGPDNAQGLPPAKRFLFLRPNDEDDVGEQEVDDVEAEEILQDDEIRQEVQREDDNTTNVRSFITKEQIIKEMDEYAANLIAFWETSKETRSQKKRDAAVWDYKEANPGWREIQITAHDRTLQRASGKLQDLRRAILAGSYTEATEIRSTCAILEGQLELYWLANRRITILKSNNRPVVTGPDVERVKRRHPPPDLKSDEELLDSDSSSDSSSDFGSDLETTDGLNPQTSREQDEVDVRPLVRQAGDSYSTSEDDDVLSPSHRPAIARQARQRTPNSMQPITPDDTDNSWTPQRLGTRLKRPFSAVGQCIESNESKSPKGKKIKPGSGHALNNKVMKDRNLDEDQLSSDIDNTNPDGSLALPAAGLEEVNDWPDESHMDLTAHVDVNGTWDEVNNQLQDSSALEQWNEKGWKDFKEFTSYDKAVIDSKATFHIPGIRMPIKFHQYYLVVWQLRRQPETGGGMVGDTMGAGKTFMALLLITIHAQIQKRRFHVRREREQLDNLKSNKTPRRLHLSLKDGQKADAQCPSQHMTFFPCPCVAHHWTARIPFNIGAAMIEVKQSLMETVWISHFRDMFGGLDHAENIWGVKLRVIHNPTTSSAKGTGLRDYKFTDTDWLHCAGREVDSDGMEIDDVSLKREEELALKALDYILLTVPSSQTKEHWNRMLSPTDDRGRPTCLNNVIPFAFCIQDEAHELAKDGSMAMQMIAGCNDPTNRMPAVEACPQPYIWFYSGTLWEENPMQQCGPKLNMLQKRAERAGQLSWSDPKSPMHKYRIEEVNRLAAQWSSLQKQKVDGTIEPDDFADQLKALVTAQAVILTRFTIKRDKTSTIWGSPLMEVPEQILHRKRCALSEAQHCWVEQADSIERRKARQAAQNRIELWKRQGSKKSEKPTFETQMKSYSVNVSSRSFPSWPALGELSQRWNDYQAQQARARWVEGQDTYSYAHKQHWSELDPHDQRTAFLLRFTQDEISSYGWDKAGAESPYSWGIDLLMDESPKCRMLHRLMRRLAATKNSDGASERAAVLSMSPATAKTLYHALADRMFNPDSKWYVGAPRVVTWLASGNSRAARTQILNNYNRQHVNPAYPNPDVLICTTGKLGVGENLTGGNWLVLFEPLNSVTTWKQAAARNVRLGMTETTHLFQFETDAPYERLMLDRLASRETSQQMLKAVLGEDILRELGMSSKQSTRATGESEESESQHETAERVGTSNLNAQSRALGIDAPRNTSDLHQNSIAAGGQRTPSKAGTPIEEFLDRAENFLAGRTEEGLED